MSSSIKVEQKIKIGEATVIESRSPCTSFAVVFEDDGQTGYFYALDTGLGEQPIMDSLHIYNADQMADQEVPSTVQIVWTDDGLKSALVINRLPHAVFDFQAKRGYCRTNFPPPSDDWSKEGHEWDDKAIQLFK